MPSKIPLAVQMYTLRDRTKADFLGTLAKIAKIGYTGVELAGTGNLPAPELKKTLDSLGLVAASAHVGIGELENSFDALVDYYRTLNCKFLVCPWWPEERRKTAADWASSGRVLNDLGAKLAAQGFTFCYHNHAFEFEKFDGKFGWDIFFETASPANLKCEMDLFWITHAGQDPAAFIKKYAGRVPLVHIKDMQAGPEKKFANVGAGIIDWKPVFQAAPAAGVQWYIVEQDNCYGQDTIEAITISYGNLRKMGIA